MSQSVSPVARVLGRVSLRAMSASRMHRGPRKWQILAKVNRVKEKCADTAFVAASWLILSRITCACGNKERARTDKEAAADQRRSAFQ